MAAAGARWGPMAVEGCPTRVLFFEEAPHETLFVIVLHAPPGCRRVSNTGPVFFENQWKSLK